VKSLNWSFAFLISAQIAHSSPLVLSAGLITLENAEIQGVECRTPPSDYSRYVNDYHGNVDGLPKGISDSLKRVGRVTLTKGKETYLAYLIAAEQSQSAPLDAICAEFQKRTRSASTGTFELLPDTTATLALWSVHFDKEPEKIRVSLPGKQLFSEESEQHSREEFLQLLQSCMSQPDEYSRYPLLKAKVNGEGAEVSVCDYIVSLVRRDDGGHDEVDQDWLWTVQNSKVSCVSQRISASNQYLREWETRCQAVLSMESLYSTPATGENDDFYLYSVTGTVSFTNSSMQILEKTVKTAASPD